jgi:hypothetical protein
VKVQEPKIVQVTKFFSWLTACILAISVLVSLYGVTSERNDLRNQVSTLALALNCRATNNFLVTRASADKQIAMAHHAVLLGDFNTLYIEAYLGEITPEQARVEADALRDQIEGSKIALSAAAENLENAAQQVDKALEQCQVVDPE